MSEETLFRLLRSLGPSSEKDAELRPNDDGTSSPSQSLADALARVTDPEVRCHLEHLLKELGYLG